MKLSNQKLIIPLALLVLAIYLFVSAPTALPDDKNSGKRIPVEVMFRILADENSAIRTLYTKEIVGPGQTQGLKFREDWKQEDVAAGPLPALLLRETSNRLQLKSPDLGLFLGSDFPIVKANLFKAVQAEEFKKVKATRQPVFFTDPSTQRQTAMFPDFSGAKPCVTCHNEHSKTPKSDWQLNDVMGATTWTYTSAFVSTDTVLQNIQYLRSSAFEAYESYLKKVQGFKGKRPEIGDKWPSQGLFLPSAEVFKATVEAQVSPKSLATLTVALNASPKK